MYVLFRAKFYFFVMENYSSPRCSSFGMTGLVLLEKVRSRKPEDRSPKSEIKNYKFLSSVISNDEGGETPSGQDTSTGDSSSFLLRNDRVIHKFSFCAYQENGTFAAINGL